MSAAVLKSGHRHGDTVVESLSAQVGDRVTYRARQEALGRRVALHVCTVPIGSPAAERFLSTARATAAAEHPHLLPVYESGVLDGIAYAITPEPPARTLADGPLPTPVALEVGSQIAGALEALQHAGITVDELSPEAVTLDTTGPHAYLLALGAPAATDRGSTTHALTSLLGDSLPRELLAGEHQSPSALMAAAHTANRRRHRHRHRRRLASGAGVLVVAVAIAAVVALHHQDAPVGGDPDAPAARLDATIPVGGIPSSVTVAGGFIYATVKGGKLVRIDPHANHVVGAPTTFRPADAINVEVRPGAGSVYVAADERLTRFDTTGGAPVAAVSRRAPHGTGFYDVRLAGDTLYASIVVVTNGDASKGRLLRLDPRSLRAVAKPIALDGPGIDLQASQGAIWALATTGSVARIDPRTGRSVRRAVGALPIQSTVLGGRLWSTDGLAGTLTATRGDTMTVESTVARLPAPATIATVAADGAIWVTALTGQDRKAPALLYRIDPRTRRPAGRPLKLGSGVGWMAAGAGAIWIRSEDRRAVLKVVPTSPAPPPRPPPPRADGTPRLRSGPLTAGRWAVRDLGVPFTLRFARPGWIALAPQPVGVSFARTDHPGGTFGIAVPETVSTAGGGIEPVRSPQQVLRALRSRPELSVRELAPLKLGGEPALNLQITARRGKAPDGVCGPSCAPLLNFGPVTYTVEESSPSHAALFRHGGKTLVATNDMLPGEDADEAEALAILRTLTFE